MGQDAEPILMNVLPGQTEAWAYARPLPEAAGPDEVAEEVPAHTDSRMFYSIWFDVQNVCTERHSTLVAVPDFNPANSPYVRALWTMGDGTTYDLPIPANDPRLSFNWMHTLHRYQTPGFYNITLTLFEANNTSKTVTRLIEAKVRPGRPGLQDTVDRCLGSTPIPLSGSPTGTNSLVWYVSRTPPAVGFDGSPTAPTPQTGQSGFFQYYVAHVGTNQCESDWDTVTVVITGRPNAPTPSPVTYCEDATALSLAGSVATIPFRSQLRWFLTNDPSEAALPTAPVPATDAGAVPGRSYYVSLRSTVGCGESPRSEVVVTIHPRPAMPVVAGMDACQGSSGVPLPNVTPLVGHSLRWWGAQATGGNWTSVSQPANASAIGTSNYYVSQVRQSNGCESRRAAIPVTIHPNPSAAISGNLVICQDAAAPQVQFTAAGGAAPYTFSYRIDGGAIQTATSDPGGTTASVVVPTAIPRVAMYQIVGMADSYGCGQGGSPSMTVRVLAKPTATLGGSNEACELASASLNFTGALGLPPYTFTYAIDNGAAQTLISAPTSSVAALSPSTAASGTFVYRLQKVSYTSGGATCEQDLSQDHPFNVLPSPTLTASIPGHTGTDLLLCQQSTSPSVRITVTNGLSPYVVNYRYQGAAQTANLTPGQSELTFPIPTDVAGRHDFELTEVRDARGCRRTYPGTRASVSILALPDATIAGTRDLCMFAGNTPVTFTGSGGKAPYTFTYALNGAPDQNLSSGTGAMAVVSAPSDQSGSFVYRLVSVSYQDGITCTKNVTGSATVTVNPSPVAPSVIPGAFCLGTAGAALPTVSPLPGHTLRWYGTSATGGAFSATVPVPSTAAAGLTNFYVSQHNTATGCESQRAELGVRIHPLPSGTIGGGTVLCQSAPEPGLLLTGAGGTAPYTFAYRLNGTDATAVSPAGSVSATLSVPTGGAGNFTYQLVGVTDANGCRQDQPSTSLFRILATPDALLSAPAETCEGSTANVTFNAGVGQAPFTFTYSLNNGPERTALSANGGNSASVAVPTMAAGPQTFRLLRVAYTDVATCSRDLTQQAVVAVNPLPDASASIRGQTGDRLLLCQDAPAADILFRAVNGTAPYRFTYRLNGGTAQTATPPTGDSLVIRIATDAASTYRYDLVGIADAKGCERPLTGNATIRIVRNPDASVADGATLCEKDAEPYITFKGTGGMAPYTFTYDVDGGTALRINSPAGADTVSLRAPTAVPGRFTYRLRQVSYTDGITCSKDLSLEAVIKINDLPRGTLTDAPAGIEVCQGQPDPLIRFSGEGGNAPYTFQYRRNGQVLTGKGNPLSVYHPTGTVGLTRYELMEVSDANGCRQAAAGQRQVTVWPTPVVDAGPDRTSLDGRPVTLQGSASNGTGLQYRWSPSTALNDATSPTPVATPMQTTRYLLRVTNDKGCADTSSMEVRVLFKPVIPNTFTPNGDGYNDRWEILHLDAYPDPILEVYSDRGQLLMRSIGTYRPWDGTYRGMPLPAGTYYYVLFARSGREKIAGYVTLLR